jgi:cytochrome c-type protein NapB
MKVLIRCLVMAGMTALLMMPVASLAEDEPNLGADAQNAEGAPPTIPHGVKDKADGKYCLVCHEKGVKGAPMTPHPERLTCTECHVPDNPAAPLPGAKKSKKAK